MALPLSFPVVARSLAAPRVGVFALELELFVLLGAASCVLRLGLPLFLLYDDKQAEWGEKRGLFIFKCHQKGNTGIMVNQAALTASHFPLVYR